MNVLFVHNALHSFVRLDRDILAMDHRVDELVLDRPRALHGSARRIRGADVVYIWFVGAHAAVPILVARMLRKPTVLVLGGYDAADLLPDRSAPAVPRVRRILLRSLCRLATALVVNAQGDLDDLQQGHVGPVPVHLVYGAFPEHEPAVSSRGSFVLSVATVSAMSLRRKGHAALARAAAVLPDARFVLAGRCIDADAAKLRRNAPENFEVTGYLSPVELEALFARGSVFVQLSADEGFGYALADAVLHGCVPVVSSQSTLREVLGEHAVYVGSVEPLEVANAIREAMGRSSQERRALQNHVARNFSIERRREALGKVFANAVSARLRPE